MGKKIKNIGQLDLFDSTGEALFPVEGIQVIQIIQKTNTKLQTNLNQDPDVYYIPPEKDPDFFPEELFLANEESPHTGAEKQDIPGLTAADIPAEIHQENVDISKLIDFLNEKDGDVSKENAPREESIAEFEKEYEEKKEDRELLENIPFIIYENGFIDGLKTREYFTIYKSVRFYLNTIDRKSGYKEFDFFLPKIREYLTRYLQRDGDIEKLRVFIKEEQGLMENKDNKLLTHFNGGADFLGMSLHYGKKEAIDIVENMLRDNKKGDNNDNLLYKAIEKKYIDSFIEQTEGQEILNLINQNEHDIFNYFQSIHTIFQNHNIDVDSIKHISNKDMWNSYTIFFKMFANCQKKINELGRENKFDFEDRFHDQYVLYMPNISEAVWDLLDYLHREKNAKIINIPHLVPMYASFLKKGKNADLIHVFKRNIIREYIYKKTRNRFNSINVAKNQERLQKTAEVFQDTKVVEYGPLGTKRTDEITRQETNELLARNGDPRIAELETLFYEEGLHVDFSINKNTGTVVNNSNNESIPLTEIIQEDKEFRKIALLEWANGEDIENPNIPNSEEKKDFDEQILTLQNILRHDKKLSEIRFFLSEDEQYLTHKLVVEEHLPLKKLFAYNESQRPVIILDRRNKADKDLPF